MVACTCLDCHGGPELTLQLAVSFDLQSWHKNQSMSQAMQMRPQVLLST
jgi:hypothetical protein